MKTIHKITAFFIVLLFASGMAFAETKSTSAGQYIEDSAITTTVKAKFMEEKGLKSSDIHVETTNGIVKLSGKVNDSSQIMRAEQIAKETDGVKSVNNTLIVK